MLTDTHCHIHEAEYPLDIGDVLQRAHEASVGRLLCVGTNEVTSQEATAFVKNHENCWASVGVHPHDTKEGWQQIETIAGNDKVVAIGEIGLDYFYTHSPREVQIKALEEQIQLALDRNLPIIFHVRDAFDDFWPIFHNFSRIRGVLHSFTDDMKNLEKGLSEGLYIGVNGISTFTKSLAQQQVFDMVPLEKMLFETDAPFLTPIPYRGKINEPAFVRVVAEYHAQRRGIDLEALAQKTSANASMLFSL